jgi:hypothetical protein
MLRRAWTIVMTRAFSRHHGVSMGIATLDDILAFNKAPPNGTGTSRLEPIRHPCLMGIDRHRFAHLLCWFVELPSAD